MLGKLFSSAAPAGSSTPSSTWPGSTHENNYDERRTRNLLFPGLSLAQSLFSGGEDGNSSLYDEDAGEGGVELDADRDVRVVIAQDRGQFTAKSVIFDSVIADARETGKDKEKDPYKSGSGLVQEEVQTPFGAHASSFGAGRGRLRSSMHSARSSFDATTGGGVSGAGNGAHRKEDEETRVLMECMFGTTAMSFKGSSTKVHVLPAGFGIRNTNGNGKSGETSGIDKNTAEKEAAEAKAKKYSNVLVTRMFSVTYPLSASSEAPTTPTENGGGHAYPFPRMTNNQVSRGIKSNRACTFAVGIIVKFPDKTKLPSGKSRNQEFDSMRSADWLSTSVKSSSFLSDPLFNLDSPLEPANENAERIDVISLHWDVVNRSLYALQKQVQDQITDMLRRLNASPSSTNARRSMELAAGALGQDAALNSAVKMVRARLVLGLKIPRVTTGQPRWDRWREECKLSSRGSGQREQNFFFYVLLNAFLGHHMDWLDVLGPTWHRRKHRAQIFSLSAQGEWNMPCKTVIVGNDRAALRRLIFILSFFLPAPASGSSGLSSLRAGTSQVLDGVHSPTASLRRKTHPRATILRPQPDGDHINLIAWDISTAQVRAVEPVPSPGSSPRVGSLPRELLTRSANLPIPIPEGANARKSSMATTATLTPVTTNAYLSSTSGLSGTGPEPRPDSSGSLASINLMHQLRRTDTAGSFRSNSSSVPNRWSGLFNVFRGDKARTSFDEGGLRSPLSPLSPHRRTFSEMTDPLGDARPQSSHFDEHDFAQEADSPPSPPSPEQPKQRLASPPMPMTTSSQTKPVAMSVDANDGFVDVDIALPSLQDFSLSSSLPGSSSTAVKSWLTDDTRVSSLSQTSICPIIDADANSALVAEQQVNVAGILSKFHPDFCLQAVEPYNELEDDIRTSLALEPVSTGIVSPGASPNGAHSNGLLTDKWRNVSTILVADTKDFRIKRFRLRSRKIRHVNQERDVIETFVSEDKIMDLDSTICEAIERVMSARAGIDVAMSARGSAMSSRENSRRGGPNPSSTEPQPARPQWQQPTSMREFTRSTIVGALEEVVRTVGTDRDATPNASEAEDLNMRRSSQGLGRLFRRTSVSESTLKEGVRRWMEAVEDGA